MAIINGINPQTGMTRQQLMAQRQAMPNTTGAGAYAGVNANPQAFASWFGQQNPAMQQSLLSAGGGGVSTPWGTLGNTGRTLGALAAGGMNQNSLNQFVNNTDANVGYNGGIGNRNPASIWDFTSGGPYYGGSTAMGAGSGNAAGLAGWSGSDAYNQANPYNANAYTGQAGTATGANGAGGATNPAASSGTGTGMTGTTGAATTAQPNTLGSIANPNAPNYALNVGSYLNPMADYMQQQGLKNIQSTYAGAGNLLSGPAMQGISNYSQNMALGNAYQPALAAAQQQQGFGYGVNQNDRNFAFQQQLANQTIPFSQQMQLAQLGLQGTQGQQNVSNLLATLLGQNAMAMGNAAGTGTIGGSNAITGALQNALQNYLGQNALNKVFPQGNQ